VSRIVARALWVSTFACACACGARSELSLPDGDATSGDGGEGASERLCAPNCTIGHQCCIGGCDGPAANTPSPCCSCLPGEVDSSQCSEGRCGG
jgi:hypothetical protein